MQFFGILRIRFFRYSTMIFPKNPLLKSEDLMKNGKGRLSETKKECCPKSEEIKLHSFLLFVVSEDRYGVFHGVYLCDGVGIDRRLC